MTSWPTNMWQSRSSLNDNNTWRHNKIITKGHHILWRFSIFLSQGIFCDGRYMTTFMTVVFRRTIHFVTNSVLFMTLLVYHKSSDFFSAPSRGGLLVGPGLLLGWFRTQIIWVNGSFYYSFAQFSVTPCRNSPFCVFSHIFGFKSCKTIISKYMWNRVNSKCIWA
jgi:hypothetical protein